MNPTIHTATQVGSLLLARRQALRLSQQDVANKLGISQNRLSELEHDPGRLTLDRLLAYASLLELKFTLAPKTPSQSKSEW